MPKQSGSTEIAASRETVWEVITDLSRLGEWVTIHRGIEGDPPTTVREGSTFTQQISVAEQDFDVDWTAVEVSPPSRMVWDGEGPMGSSARSTYELSDAGEKVSFTYSTEFAPPGGKVGEVAATAVESRGQEETDESLKRLKQLLEG